MLDVPLTVLFERTDAVKQRAAFALIDVDDSLPHDDIRLPDFADNVGQKTLLDVAVGPYTIRVTHPSVSTSVTEFFETLTGPGPAAPL